MINFPNSRFDFESDNGDNILTTMISGSIYALACDTPEAHRSWCAYGWYACMRTRVHTYACNRIDNWIPSLGMDGIELNM